MAQRLFKTSVPIGRGFASATCALVLGAALAIPSAVEAQGACDPQIERNSRGGILGYQSRGEHCEGLYATDVAATVMWVASLTEVFEDYDLASSGPLHVSWSAPEGADLHLRAHGIKRDLYYRMDTQRAGASRDWAWPTDFLASQRIESGDIGVLGWTTERVGGVDHNLFVPVRVTQEGGGATASGGTYELVVVPNVRLQEVYVSLAKASSTGAHPEGPFIRKQEPLGQRVYPTQRPIRIELSGMTEPGVYFVEVTATRSDGKPVTLDPLWIYHAGRSR